MTINKYLISEEILGEYCKHLINKVFKLLYLKEDGKDIISPVNKILEELKGATISDLELFVDNQYILEILFLIAGLKEEKNFAIYRTIILDCCNLIDLLPERLIQK
jgi:hypothetical protein